MGRMTQQLLPKYEWMATEQKLALDQREKDTLLDGGARWELEQAVVKSFQGLDQYNPDNPDPDRQPYPDFTKGDQLDAQINDISDAFLHSLSDAVKTAGNEVKMALMIYWL